MQYDIHLKRIESAHVPDLRDAVAHVEELVSRFLHHTPRIVLCPIKGVAYTVHEGSYEALGEAYRALFSWVNTEGYEAAGAPRELYLVGPAVTEDSSAYRTEVSVPVRKSGPAS